MDMCKAAEFVRQLRRNRAEFDPITWSMPEVREGTQPHPIDQAFYPQPAAEHVAPCNADNQCIVDAIQLATRPALAHGVTDTKAYIIETPHDGVFQLVPNNPMRRLFACWGNGAFISIGASPEQVGTSIQSVADQRFPTFICDENTWGGFATVQWFFKTTSIAPIKICVWEELYLKFPKKENFS